MGVTVSYLFFSLHSPTQVVSLYDSTLGLTKPLTREELYARLDRKLRKSSLFHLDEDGKTVHLIASL